MVRRPASVLIAAYAATFVYLLITPVLPDIGGTSDTNTLVSDIPTMLLFAVCVFVWLPAREEPVPLVFVALGAGLVAAAATEAGSVPVGDVTKLMFSAAVGLLLSKVGSEPEFLIAVPPPDASATP